MLVVEMIVKISAVRFCVHGEPIKIICREPGSPRKIVRNEFRYDREGQAAALRPAWTY